MLSLEIKNLKHHQSPHNAGTIPLNNLVSWNDIDNMREGEKQMIADINIGG